MEIKFLKLVHIFEFLKHNGLANFFLIYISSRSYEKPITISNFYDKIFGLLTFWVKMCSKVCLMYLMNDCNQLYWHFLVRFHLNRNLYLVKKTQKVNKQKICCKNSRFALVLRMSWTRYRINKMLIAISIALNHVVIN